MNIDDQRVYWHSVYAKAFNEMLAKYISKSMIITDALLMQASEESARIAKVALKGLKKAIITADYPRRM